MENSEVGFKLSDDKKLTVAMRHLKNGGEIRVNGVTYVWLDNYVIREEQNEDGTTTYYGIDGLAIKGEKHNLTTGEKSVYYVGQQDMPMNVFLKELEGVSEFDWFGMASEGALRSLIPKR